VTLANQGYSPLGILRYYYGNDVTLQSAPVSSATESYPGTALRVGSSGESVRRLQTFLNRIRVNYPAIPAIVNPNGYFGEDTANAVRVFQRVFSLTQDGVAGKATWNKVSQIYAAIIKLSELDGEGEKEGVTQTPPALPVLKRGASGSDVSRLQFLINFASDYYPAVPEISQDGIFGSGTENAVKAFQKQFGLTQDGIVGAATWAKLYDLYNGATGTTPSPSAPAYPGTPLKNGSRSESVRIAQTLLNAAGASLTADGIFGPATESAVKAFQSRNGLTADGIIGPATWSKLTAKSAGTALAAPILPAPVLPIPVRTPAPAPIPTPVLPTPIPAPVAPIRVPYKGTPLREGCKGEEVLWIQRRLNTLKKRFPEIPELLADGRFGEATAAAVKIFQRVSGILSYGIVGSATWRLLNEIGEIID
jgi:peptidoglycan hydrolase-like protein with peptidoglycan-binding domain